MLMLTAMAVMHVGFAGAEPVPVKGGEIREMLSGNTIHGSWNGEEYRQYFTTYGATTYAVRNSPPTRGKWRVNVKKDMYESWWEQSDWSAYRIVRDNGKLFWTTIDGKDPQPFVVLEGEQMHWNDN